MCVLNYYAAFHVKNTKSTSSALPQTPKNRNQSLRPPYKVH